METLKQLIELGFSPMVALLVAAFVVLWGSFCTVGIVVWRQQAKNEKARDQIRESWKQEINARLELSEQKHEACERDRDRLEVDLQGMKSELLRIKQCSAGASCPMRLPA